MRVSKLATLAALMISMGGCSMALDWHPDHLPCNGQVCDAGFSCLTIAEAAGSAPGCVRDDTLKVGLGCTLDRQCADGSRCVAGACRAPCAAPYRSGQCASTEVCDHPADVKAPACLPSDGCVPGGTCWDARAGLGVCVAFSDSERRCLPPCSDAGDAPCAEGRVCAAMGLSGQQELVCVPPAARGPM